MRKSDIKRHSILSGNGYPSPAVLAGDEMQIRLNGNFHYKGALYTVLQSPTGELWMRWHEPGWRAIYQLEEIAELNRARAAAND